MFTVTNIAELLLLSPYELWQLRKVCTHWSKHLLSKKLFHDSLRNMVFKGLQKLDAPICLIRELCEVGAFVSGGFVLNMIRGVPHSWKDGDIDIFIPLGAKGKINWQIVNNIMEADDFKMVPWLSSPKDTEYDPVSYSDEEEEDQIRIAVNVPKLSHVRRVQTYERNSNRPYWYNWLPRERMTLQFIEYDKETAADIVEGFDIDICKTFISLAGCRNWQERCRSSCNCHFGFGLDEQKFGMSVNTLVQLFDRNGLFHYDVKNKLEVMKATWIENRSVKKKALQTTILNRISKYIEKGFQPDQATIAFRKYVSNPSLALESSITMDESNF